MENVRLIRFKTLSPAATDAYYTDYWCDADKYAATESILKAVRLLPEPQYTNRLEVLESHNAGDWMAILVVYHSNVATRIEHFNLLQPDTDYLTEVARIVKMIGKVTSIEIRIFPMISVLD